MGRQDSTTLLRSSDFGIDSAYLWLRLTEKQRKHVSTRRIVRIPIAPPPSNNVPSAIPQIVRLAHMYMSAKTALGEPTQYLFQLPHERPPTTAAMSTWVAQALRHCGISAPKGFAYLGHSIRSGASSAAEAIKVPRIRGDWLGGWAPGTSTRAKHYIDPTLGPSTEAFALLGWLLDHEYQIHD